MILSTQREMIMIKSLLLSAAAVFAAGSVLAADAHGPVISSDAMRVSKATNTVTFTGHVMFSGAWLPSSKVFVDGAPSTAAPAAIAPAERAEVVTQDGVTTIRITTYRAS
jgi:hypothetical protein